VAPALAPSSIARTIATCSCARPITPRISSSCATFARRFSKVSDTVIFERRAAFAAVVLFAATAARERVVSRASRRGNCGVRVWRRVLSEAMEVSF